MQDSAQQLVQTIEDAHLAAFGQRLADWLIADLNQGEEEAPAFTESRAKALLRGADVIDDPTLHSFTRTVAQPPAARIALYDLLRESGLAQNDEVKVLAATSGAAGEESIQWLSLALAAFAWKSEYPLHQLDPSSPPTMYSPAGQVVKRTAYFMRQQVQRSATDRDKLARKLAYRPGTAVDHPAAPDEMEENEPIAPLPPHFRSPIPVRYPEVSRDTIQVDAEESEQPETAGITRNPPITITDEDLDEDTADTTIPPGVTRMPPIRISEDQITEAAPPPQSRVNTPPPSTSAGSSANFSEGVRNLFGRGREPLKSTKLRIIVQEYPDGPGLYGLQVKVTCKGVKSYVAGTTNREGQFLCELPVRVNSGLTYDVDITWPRDMGGDVERKSVTLNADRTEFKLPFYRRIHHEDV